MLRQLGLRVSKLGAVLRKSQKLRDFKEGDMPIKEWLRRWNHEVESQRKMCGIVGDLTRDEGINIFRDKLDFTVVRGWTGHLQGEILW